MSTKKVWSLRLLICTSASPQTTTDRLLIMCSSPMKRKGELLRPHGTKDARLLSYTRTPSSHFGQRSRPFNQSRVFHLMTRGGWLSSCRTYNGVSKGSHMRPSCLAHATSTHWCGPRVGAGQNHW